ncbi:predicted protein [Naegleria gruberi]|uniref:Predicted protein n=1 Tax=Naegleria gruberi TaxID=5762 RepID=D2V1B5_NAEGR|nr:uncharacterized protein NAEGRDRAFT_62827 [Naegleria gruberi]EFC49441.1 predicted protein [Naegleria gruberi]|eukprot:XP_002682185.1 predicted protein [Naegleria gruberi strain NEG-M]
MITPINSNVPNTTIDLFSIEKDKFGPSFSLDSNNDKFYLKTKGDTETSSLINQENVENSIDKIDHTLDKLEAPLEEIDSNLEEMKEKIRKVMDLTSETLQHSYQQPTTSTFEQNTEDEYESSSSFQYLNERDLVEDATQRIRQTNPHSNSSKRIVSPPQRKDSNVEKVLENSFHSERVSPRRRKKEVVDEIIDEEVDELIESPDETIPAAKDTRKFVTKEENEPKKYYRIATMSTGFLFLINSFLLYFGGEGKLNMDNLYGYGGGSSHLQRTAAVLFLVMGIVNLTPNIFGGEDGFSLERAAEYFPFVVALLNVVVSAHYIFENIRASATFNWIAFAGLIVFIVLNVKLASLSHPGALVRKKK